MRHLLAAFLAAIAMFMWGFTAWAALDLYKFAFPTVGTSSESAIVSTLATELPEDGAYFVPHVPAGYGQGTEDPAKQAEFERQHAAQPSQGGSRIVPQEVQDFTEDDLDAADSDPSEPDEE